MMMNPFQELAFGQYVPHCARVLARFRHGTYFDQSLQTNSFRRSRPMDRKTYEALADGSNEYTVVGQDLYPKAPRRVCTPASPLASFESPSHWNISRVMKAIHAAPRNRVLSWASSQNGIQSYSRSSSSLHNVGADWAKTGCDDSLEMKTIKLRWAIHIIMNMESYDSLSS